MMMPSRHRVFAARSDSHGKLIAAGGLVESVDSCDIDQAAISPEDVWLPPQDDGRIIEASNSRFHDVAGIDRTGATNDEERTLDGDRINVPGGDARVTG
jgi:hypothetical protein